MQTNGEAAKYTFNLPACIPNGEYLFRIQSLAIYNPGSTPQWYMSCAQLAVTGGGTKDLGPKVAIPGAFKATDPGYTVNIYNNVSELLFKRNLDVIKKNYGSTLTLFLDQQLLPAKF
jgi:Auxiliary Activity family 9 (formerly GH61)